MPQIRPQQGHFSLQIITRMLLMNVCLSLGVSSLILFIFSWNLDLISEVSSFLTNFTRFVRERYLMDFSSIKIPLSSALDFIKVVRGLIGLT